MAENRNPDPDMPEDQERQAGQNPQDVKQDRSNQAPGSNDPNRERQGSGNRQTQGDRDVPVRDGEDLNDDELTEGDDSGEPQRNDPNSNHRPMKADSDNR